MIILFSPNPNPLKKKKPTTRTKTKTRTRTKQNTIITQSKTRTKTKHTTLTQSKNFPKFTTHGTGRILRRTHFAHLPRTRFGAPNCSWRTPDPNTSSQSRRLRTRRPHGFESHDTTKTPSSPSFKGNNLVLFFLSFWLGFVLILITWWSSRILFSLIRNMILICCFAF